MKEKFSQISEVDDFVKCTVEELNDIADFIFQAGSFVRGSPTKFSDLDYTACVSNEFSHSKFIFSLIKLKSEVRLLSIYFYSTEKEFLPQKYIDRETYLWMKGMMPNTRLVYGNKMQFKKIKNDYEKSICEFKIDQKVLHKSYGKLFELLNRVKKFASLNNETEMLYYGLKLAEHSKRIVIELNAPFYVISESKLLDALFTLNDLPENYETIYKVVSRFVLKKQDIDSYLLACQQLVENLINFVQKNKDKCDPATLNLLNSRFLEEYLKL